MGIKQLIVKIREKMTKTKSKRKKIKKFFKRLLRVVLLILAFCIVVYEVYAGLSNVFFREYQRYAGRQNNVIKTAYAKESAEESKPDPLIVREQQIREYLEAKKSPLASASKTLAKSNDWKLIIAISYAESTFCKQYPKPTANCWGVGGASGLWDFGTNLTDGVNGIQNFLANYPRGSKKYNQMTASEMNGIYCQDSKQPGKECVGWTSKVNGVLNELKNIK